MPDPLLTYRLYDALNDAAKMPNKQDQQQAILMLMVELPVAHLHTLMYIMQLLADVVAITGNKVGSPLHLRLSLLYHCYQSDLLGICIYEFKFC